MASRIQNRSMQMLVVIILLGAGTLPFINSGASKTSTDATVAPSDALLVANHKLAISNKLDYRLASLTPISDHGQPLFYMIALQPTGYIVVSAYRFLPVIMAYSWTSEFGAFTNDNPLYGMLVTDITQRIAGAGQLPQSLIATQSAEWEQFLTEPATRSFEQWPPEGSSPTDGWVITLWTQGTPYNDMCPVINAQRSAAGCPAVAMAQIVNYFHTTNNIQFSDTDDYYHSYSGANFWIDNDYLTWQFPSWPQLNSYLQTVESHWASNTSLTNQDKAALNVACGFAMEQVYNPSGSGTFGVDQAYQAYQRFNFTSSLLYMGESQEMFNILSHNIRQAIPAHIAVVNEGWTVGHNMVVDGYNTDDFYHINFGWGGSYNGWYHIPDDLPYELTVVEGVIVNIIPGSNQAPETPGQIYGPTETQINLNTTFWVNSVSDPEGDPVLYQWDWGDGVSTLSGNSSSHSWTQEGQYNLRVKAIDSFGAESNWSAPFTVSVTAPRPVLVIAPSVKGIGVSAAIENHGAAAATDVAWTLNVSGGLFNLIKVQQTGLITAIPAGQNSLIESGTFMGLGKITVEFTAACTEGNTTSLTKQGNVFFIWVRLT
jgi:hypothetical protein